MPCKMLKIIKKRNLSLLFSNLFLILEPINRTKELKPNLSQITLNVYFYKKICPK